MSIKVLFITIWIFFIFRITSYINLDNNVFQFNLKNFIKFFQDSLSIIILVGLSIYSLFKIVNKKIHISIILIIYPICGLIGYFENSINNAYQDFILLHHFITLCSVFLFFAVIQSDKVFDYNFRIILFKIILIFIFLFFLLNILPDVLSKLFFNKEIRFSYKSIISILGSQFEINQNVNGSARIMFILLVVFLILFKKFILKKKILAYTCFFISTILFTIIYLLQSRLNILASFFFSFFLIFNIKNLNFKKKLIYFLTLVFIVIFINDVVLKNNNRFTTQYSTPSYEFNFKDSAEIKSVSKKIAILLENKQSIIFNITNDLEKLNLLIASLASLDRYSNKESLIFLDLLKNIEQKNNNLSDLETKIMIKETIEDSYKIIKRYEHLKLTICSPTLKSWDNLLSGRLCGWMILLDDIQINDLLFGKGFFADQVYLKTVEKISSNSWLNIFYNTGIISLFLCLTFLTFSLLKFFKIKNINHENFFISLSHYLLIYFIARSVFEDVLAFVSIDFLCSFICLLIVKKNMEKKFSR
jgi:hypothetical protein